MPAPKRTSQRSPSMIGHDPPARPKKDAELIADALLEVAKSLDRVATQIKYLGAGQNGSEMGAIEFLGVSIQKAIEGHNIGDGLQAVANAISDLQPPSAPSPGARAPK